MRTSPLSKVIVVNVELARLILASGRQLHSGLLVVAHALLKEVGLALKADHVHPLERVLHVEVLGHAQLE